MDNHYHLLIETPDANLSLGMRQLNGMYTQNSNRRHKKVGHLFQGRFKSIVVERNSHLLELCRYIVNNPVAAGMCKDPGDWKWSSYIPTAFGINVPDFLTVDWVLDQFSKSSSKSRPQYHEFVVEGLSNQKKPWEDVDGQVVLGSKSFVKEMQTYLSADSCDKEIPSIQRSVGRPSLAELFPASINTKKELRNQSICKAHLSFSYKLKEIAEYLGIHYTTVSKVISTSIKK